MSEGGRVRRKRKSRIPVRQPTGLYVHSSPPTVLPVHPSIVRQWLRGGEVGRLQDIVLKGQGSSLVGEYSPDSKARAFINALPRILKKVEELHNAARAGKVDQVDAVVKSEPRINLELSRDSAGTGILHKAVIHGHIPLQEFLLKNYPKTVEVLDRERRNPLHYAAGNEEVWNRLVAGGADTTTVDREGFSPAFYMNHPRRLRPPAPESRSKVPSTNQGLVVKPSNIRIWIHDKDLGRLQKVLWEGMGDKLKTETSSQPLVRRFLNAVPYIMGLIRDVHSAAVNNDVELLQSKSADPVPKDILLSKDANGLNPLHKAAGLGHMEVARAILERAPEAVNAKDHQDRTPLHYAAALKDQNQMYQMLVDYEATDHLEDKKGNTPSHYRAKPSELEGPKLLNVVPDAPRTAHIFPPSWDWRLLTGESSGETPITSPQTETPPQKPTARAKDMEAPKPEPAEEEVKQEEEEEKPPEIEPTPDEEEKVQEQEKSVLGDAPGVSDDEGVGSEANPSVENTSTPLSDTVNEEEEISGARLGETVTLSSSLFRSQGPTIESKNGNDSGNEDGDSNGKGINEENGEVEPSVVTERLSSRSTRSAVASYSQENAEPGDLPNGDSIDAVHSATKGVRSRPSSQKSGSISRADNSTTTNGQNESSRPSTAIQVAQPDGNAEGGDVEGETAETDEHLENQNHVNTLHEESAENTEGTIDSHSTNQHLGSSQDLNSTYTKLPAVDASAANENGVDEDGEENTIKEVVEGRSSQLGAVLQNDSDKNETDGKEGEIESTVEDQLPESNANQIDESTKNEIPESGADQATESQSRPCSHGNDSRPRTGADGVQEDTDNQKSNGNQTSSKPGTATDASGVQEDSEHQNPDENQSTKIENSEPSAPEGENQLTPDRSAESSTTEGNAAEEAMERKNDDSAGVVTDEVESESATGVVDEAEKTEGTPAKLEQTETKDASENDETGKDSLDQPITLRSAGGSRAEVLAITPAPPEDDVTMGDDQKAVAEGNTEADRAIAAELVAAGDMESMAEMVLNGKGAALLNMESNNADVQLFINNIPQYIAKIERVHTAAREGDLRGVQTALDRRKFAVARDNNTPLKPTPLHVAALFGRTSVLRYLAGRFPETMHAKDAGGRTALHYAATLPDNGHFYSLLITLGADKSVIDNEGRTAEHYLRNKGELTRDELLNEYQNRPVPIDTTGLNFNRFSDKGAEIIKGGYPIFNPEEGQYLANSLGEPLIKGLTEVAHVRPKNPVVHLANFLLVYSKPEEGNNRKTSGKRAVTAKMEPPVDEALPSDDAPTDEAENPEGEDQLETDEPTTADAEGEGDREELEDREDDEEVGYDDNASVSEDPPEPAEPAFKPTNRDEHGQTILHFAAARSHGRNAIYQLLQEMDVNVGLRDGLYRTARDISEQMEISDNVQGIDKFVVAIAARGENEKLTELLLEGYDHILDAEDGGSGIIDVANERENMETVELLQGITAFEERREKLIRAIRFGSIRQVRELFREAPNKLHLAIAKNQQGRCSLHVAVLAQHENIVEYIAKRFPSTLHIGDNLMRSPLHYAMGVEKVEPLSRILIAAGAQRVVKDLKGRQPSYYFMNKTDIQKLQDEEEALRV